MIVAKRFPIALGIAVSAWFGGVFCGTAAAQATIHVPADVPSIGQAINQAQNGDTVLVSPGTYDDTIDFQGKAITVASTDGPAVTILDARYVTSVAFFMSGEGPQSVLRGFTLTHGISASEGGAILIQYSSPTIDGNIITANQACEGIGIAADFSSAIIKNNVITNNQSSGLNCSFAGGGGIRIAGTGSAQILNNVITGNQTAGDGGGIELITTSPITIAGNTIQHNAATSGGGISVETGSSANIVNNLITDNSGFGGTGIYLVGQSGNQNLLINNTIAFNTNFGFGSQVELDGSQSGTQLFNNVIIDGTGGGAVTCGAEMPSFTSNDFLSIAPTTPPQPVTPLLGVCFDVTGMNGNIQVDPQFVNPTGGDYHLQASSPAIDAGSNTAPNLPDKDLDGNARIGPGNAATCAGTIDMGAYEFALSSSGTGFLSATSLDFGTVPVGGSSGTQTVYGFAQGCVQIASITTAGDFSQTNNCGHALSSSSPACAIQITFTPTTAGPGSGSLNVDFGTSAPAVSTTLTGQGLAVAASASPTSLTFADQVIGTTSATQTVTVNGGGGALQISSVSISGDYAQTNSCFGPPVAAPTCLVNVSFSPIATGSRPGTMVINTNQGSFSIALNGNGINPQGQLSSSSLTFGNQLVNTTSSPQAVTLTNIGVGTLQILGFTLGGDFALTNNCGSSLAQGAACTINVTFHPTAVGPRTGFFMVFTNNGNPGASLSGIGVVPVASVSPSALTFANQLVGSTSLAQAVTLSNTGGAPLHITSITASGDFAETNSCGASLDPGASCSVNVTFTPAATGSRTGSLAIASDGGSPSVSLSGTGVAPVAIVAPTALSFPDQLLNTTSSPQAVTLNNTGTAALQIASISVSGNYLQTNNCGASLDPAASCSISVSFAPASLGQRPGTLTVTSNGGPASVTLTGNGIAAIPSVSPSSVTFGNQLVGTTSAAQAVTLTNSGNIALNISSITASTGFGQTNSCGASLAPGASCSINVTFTPFAAQTISGNLSFSTDGFGGAPAVALSGQGIAPVANLSPASLTFASQVLNTTSAAQTISLSNTGSATMQLTSISITSTSGSGTNGFAQTNNCGSSLDPGASCAISVTFTPDTLGARGAVLTVSSNAPSAVASLSGTGIAAIASVAPQSLTFGNQLVQTSSPAQAVTLTNSGNIALAISAITATGDFAQTNNCGTSLAAGAACVINVTFTPTARFARSGSLTVQSNSTPPAPSVALSGTGIAPAAVLSPSSVNFGSQRVGTPSAGQAMTLSNNGDAALTMNGFLITGSSDFTQTNNCPGSVAPGQNCVVTVVFAPSSRGAKAATISVNTQPLFTTSAPLSGTGIAPVAVLTPSLDFGLVNLGTSAIQNATLSNVGDLPLTISGIAVSGGGYSQTNSCGGSVAAGGSCTIQVSFQASVLGVSTGALTVTDDDPAGSTQSTSLTGAGVDFTVGASPTSVTVLQGQTAVYTISLAPLGGSFPNSVSLACGGLPSGTTCSFSANPVVPGTAGASSVLSVTTSNGQGGTRKTSKGSHTITVSGVSGNLKHTVAITLVVD